MICMSLQMLTLLEHILLLFDSFLMGDLKEHLTNGQNFMEISLFINYTLYFFER